jgi:hypothetical protein
MSTTATINEQRVLLLAPTPADAALSESLLAEAGLISLVCADVPQLSRELQAGVARSSSPRASWPAPIFTSWSPHSSSNPPGPTFPL